MLHRETRGGKEGRRGSIGGVLGGHAKAGDAMLVEAKQFNMVKKCIHGNRSKM